MAVRRLNFDDEENIVGISLGELKLGGFNEP